MVYPDKWLGIRSKGTSMFNYRKWLILSLALLFLGSVISPLITVPLIILIVASFPLVGAFLSSIWLERSMRRKEPLTVKIDPDYRERKCPACDQPVSTKDVICKNCYENLVLNCPNCGEILYKERTRCPTCKERIAIDVEHSPKTRGQKVKI